MASNSTNNRRSKTVADRAAAVADDFHEIGDAARQMANHGVTAVRDTAVQYLDEGRSRVQHLGDEIHSRVAERPMKSLLIAAGVGFLLGAIWTRR
jgi:ElaB/YqjD/DUF883 family membrane-anchored ribosome-binding protein